MDAALQQRLIRIKLSLAQRENDPLGSWRFAVPRVRQAFGLFTGPRPIDELHARACNKGTKTETAAAYVLACLQKRATLDGVQLPQWRGRVEGAQLVLDFPQQILSVQPAYLRLLGRWPHRARYRGETLISLRVKPVGGNDDERTWSSLHFLSQKNHQAGTGVRGDIIAFDEPPSMEILRELRKAAHANRRSVCLIAETPTLRRQWQELKEDYGECPRRTIRRVDQERAEVRWSLDEVADWVLSPEDKAKLRRKYATDPLKEAREHGDYIDTSGMCPFDLVVLEAMLAECRAPEMISWNIKHEVTEGARRVVKTSSVPVQVWQEPTIDRVYYIAIDPASGVQGGHPLGLHVTEVGSGDLVARYLGHHSPYVVGVLAAGLARQYNNATVQPEINDGWATGVFQALSDAGYGNIGREQNELRPGQWHTELGFRTTVKTRPGKISAVKQWIEAWGAGVKYAACPSSEVIRNLMDVILDDADKPVVIPGAHHGEDMILRGQSIMKCVDRSGMEIPDAQQPIQTREQKLIDEIMGRGTAEAAEVGERLLVARARPRL